MLSFHIRHCKAKHQTSQVLYNVPHEHITSSFYSLPQDNRDATRSIIMTSIAPPTSPYTSSSPTSTTSTRSPTHKRTRVTAEHTLFRVRENQRRHRARRKDYIATLEQKLAETEAQLASARADIDALRRENDARHDRRSDRQKPDARAGIESEMLALEKLVDTLPTPPLGDVFAFDLVPETAPLPALEDTPAPLAIAATGPPPCCTDPEPVPPLRAASPECSSCHTRPAPAPTESTTLCAQAYVLIAQQNFRGIDAGTIRMWLYQGYRRARRDGEGCRVENGALFRLLDYISGVWDGEMVE
jgi:hypothetical protein